MLGIPKPKRWHCRPAPACSVSRGWQVSSQQRCRSTETMGISSGRSSSVMAIFDETNAPARPVGEADLDITIAQEVT